MLYSQHRLAVAIAMLLSHKSFGWHSPASRAAKLPGLRTKPIVTKLTHFILATFGIYSVGIPRKLLTFTGMLVTAQALPAPGKSMQ
eukprot:703649-Pelagomonas_calceolata.AAC.1